MIAVIAILASLLLPSLNAARVAAKSSACISNERQLALACSIYSIDSQQGYLPPFSCYDSTPYCLTGAGSGVYYWFMEIHPYIAGNASFPRPAATGSYRAPATLFCPRPNPVDFISNGVAVVNYLYNGRIGCLAPSYPNYGVRILPRCKVPSKAMLLCDVSLPSVSSTPCYDPPIADAIYTSHNAHGNFAFVDGHAEGIRMMTASDIKANCLFLSGDNAGW